MTENKMPDVIWAITYETDSGHGEWDDYQWSDQRGTEYLRAEPVKAMLKQAQDVLKEIFWDQRSSRMDDTITAIDKFLEDKE